MPQLLLLCSFLLCQVSHIQSYQGSSQPLELHTKTYARPTTSTAYSACCSSCIMRSRSVFCLYCSACSWLLMSSCNAAWTCALALSRSSRACFFFCCSSADHCLRSSVSCRSHAARSRQYCKFAFRFSDRVSTATLEDGAGAAATAAADDDA